MPPRTFLMFLGLALLMACAPTAPITSFVGQQHQLTAQQVVEQLAQRLPTVKLGLVYTAEIDPNHLLGRPGQYSSKVAFTDSRIQPAPFDAPDSIDRGGSVEVFDDAQGATTRMKYIQAIASGFPMAVEYDYTSGPVLVRVGKIFTPAQAGEYQKALAAIGGG
jgi:hypothetical protein